MCSILGEKKQHYLLKLVESFKLNHEIMLKSFSKYQSLLCRFFKILFSVNQCTQVLSSVLISSFILRSDIKNTTGSCGHRNLSHLMICLATEGRFQIILSVLSLFLNSNYLILFLVTVGNV
jgi:hypothetical protein